MNPGSLADSGSAYGPDRPSDPSGPATRVKTGRWWGRARPPVVLRLPVGLAVALGLTFLCLLVLAYWAGQVTGRRDAQALVPVEPGRGSLRHDTNLGRFEAQLGLSPGQTQENGVPLVTTAGREGRLRKTGFNYFVLAHYPKADAQRLVAFLAEHGVESAAFKPHNGRLFQVVALQGFERNQIDGPVRQQFEQKLRQLGRLWKSRRHGPDFSQTGIYLDLYENEAAAETLQLSE